MRSRFFIISVVLAQIAGAQGATVSGTVRDSVGATPLAGALVQLVVADSAGATPRTVIADSAGRYRIDGVSPGRYVISFLHPILDSLTLEPVLHALDVTVERPIQYDLGTPSGPTLRGLFCHGATITGAAFVGVVRDAMTGAAIGGAEVKADWLDMVITRGSVATKPARRTATTNGSGWFVLCGLPGPGNVSIGANRGSDSMDVVDIGLQTSMFARRDLYLARAGNKGTLRGRVLNRKGQALTGAIVTVGRGSRTRSSPDGEWSLSDLPLGTRALEVRAIGYYPERRAVDVTSEPHSVLTEMSTFEAVLDTMRVSSTLLNGRDDGGFEQRRRSSGFGRFLTEQEIRRKAPVELSDVFKSVPGVYHLGDAIKMRSAFGSFGGGDDQCLPNIFVDGNLLPVHVADLDGWLRPSDISSIEVYPDVPPAQFQVALSGCGSIVFWTKRRPLRGGNQPCSKIPQGIAKTGLYIRLPLRLALKAPNDF